MKMVENNTDGADTAMRRVRMRRAMFGASYGFLSGTAFAFIAAFIDVWLNPDLPLGLDWSMFGTRLFFIGLGLALAGAVTCWWDETWQGLLSGSVTSAALALIFALLSSEVGAGMKLLVLAFILLPIAAMTLPIAWFLRRLTERHAVALHSTWRTARIAGLVLLAIAPGAGGGIFMKTSASELEATRFVHALLQSPTAEKNPISKVDGVQERFEVPYRLYQSSSVFSTEGYDIRIEYEDGFMVKCAVVLYPGRDPYISTCQPEGSDRK